MTALTGEGEVSGAAEHVGAIEREPPANAPIVLVAEDNQINEQVAVANLEQLGCRVRVARDGREAIEMLEQGPFACIFMDCQMPVMDGYEATAEIRRREAGVRHTPIVAMTAHAMKGDRERCIDAGMDDYLSKPLRRGALSASLKRWLVSGSDGQHEAGQGNRGSEGVGSLALDPPHGTEGAVDSARIAQLVARFGSHQALGQLADLFESQTTGLVANMRRAIELRDGDGLWRSAHKLRGGSATLAAGHMADLCQELELNARECMFEAATALVDRIEAAFRAVRAEWRLDPTRTPRGRQR